MLSEGSFGRGVFSSLLLLVPVSTGFAQPHDHVRVQPIDRGQADGILIRTPNEEWVVIDAGTNGQQAEAMRDDWGVDTVVLAIVSHRHFDHHGGMDDVFDLLPVNRFLGSMEDCSGNVSDDSVRAAVNREPGVAIQPLGGDTVEIDGVRFIVLPQPPAHERPDEENNNSVVVRMEFGDFSMLFTGDAEEDERDWLVANHPELLDVDVLKASHHGSRNGTDSTWLAAVTPERVVISAGVNASFGHPHQEAVDAYIGATGNAGRVYCTNRHMTVRVYGRENGNIRVVRQNPINKSCVFDGTHY